MRDARPLYMLLTAIVLLIVAMFCAVAASHGIPIRGWPLLQMAMIAVAYGLVRWARTLP